MVSTRSSLLFIALKAFLARKENCGMYEEEGGAMGIWFFYGMETITIFTYANGYLFFFF
jgi:hypothetical protein